MTDQTNFPVPLNGNCRWSLRIDMKAQLSIMPLHLIPAAPPFASLARRGGHLPPA